MTDKQFSTLWADALEAGLFCGYFGFITEFF